MKPPHHEQIDERLLIKYADDELDPAQRAEVDRYLGEHPESRALMDAYRADIDRVRKGLADPFNEIEWTLGDVSSISGNREFARIASHSTSIDVIGRSAPPLTSPVDGGKSGSLPVRPEQEGKSGSLPVHGEGWGGGLPARSLSLAESKTVRSSSMYAIAGVERRIRRQRIRRRASYTIGTVCAVAVLVLTLWPASPSAPVAAPAQPNEAAARLAGLNDRIANLERQVAELETALERREPVEIGLSLGELAQEETAAIVYEAGRFYERDDRNVALALSRYRDVVTRFPNTKSAASAEERIRALTQAQDDRRLES